MDGGQGPESRASAPAKAILFGEHFIMHGTGAILCAIDSRVRATCGKTQSGIRISSSLGTAEAGPDGIGAGPVLGALAHAAAGALRGKSGGISVAIDSDIEPGMGLGSSSACCVAASHAALGLFGSPSQEQSYDLALHAERTAFAGASGADSAACAYGGIIRYKDGRAEQLPSAGGLELVIVNSKQRHNTADVVAGVQQFCSSNPERFGQLCRLESELISRAAGALAAGSAEALGECMSQNQQYLEEIGVSSGPLREIVSAAGSSCYGAKLTGAGRGGCVIAAARGAAREAAEALSSAGYAARAAQIDRSGVVNF